MIFKVYLHTSGNGRYAARSIGNAIVRDPKDLQSVYAGLENANLEAPIDGLTYETIEFPTYWQIAVNRGGSPHLTLLELRQQKTTAFTTEEEQS